MFEIVFLGTSASAPSVNRGLSAAVVMYNEYRFLIDCGEGTQRQLLKSGLGFRRLDKILLTHGHLDHILGLGGLASTFSRWEAIDHIDIHGGVPALRRVRTLIEDVVLGNAAPPIRIDYCPLTPGVIMQDQTFTLSAFAVSHRGAGCFGFLFQEKTRRPFDNERATALGIPFGPERRDLVAGNTITLPDGRSITPDDVLGEPIEGTKLVFMADVGKTEGLHDIVQDAHALVIEATYLESEADMAHRFGHITAAQAATLAAKANVQTLYLTHLSRRYRTKDIVAEARAIFPNTIVVNDFDRFQVNHKDDA